MAKHIGIAAVSPEGSALCYREIFRYAARKIGGSGHPVVTIHNEPLEQYITAVLKNDWHTVGDLLAKSSKVLAAAGAEFCIVPDNLMQYGVHLAERRSPVPWLTMTDLVAESIAADGRKQVGLIGTKMVMLGSTYQTYLGLRGVRVLVPEAAEAEIVDSIIFRELLYGVVKMDSIARVMSVIQHLADRGCEAVILGCSEAPLLVQPDASPIPVYNATTILAEGAVRYAIGERAAVSSGAPKSSGKIDIGNRA